ALAILGGQIGIGLESLQVRFSFLIPAGVEGVGGFLDHLLSLLAQGQSLGIAGDIGVELFLLGGAQVGAEFLCFFQIDVGEFKLSLTVIFHAILQDVARAQRLALATGLNNLSRYGR